MAIISSPLSTVGLHVLWFGGLLHSRTHPTSFASYRQSFFKHGALEEILTNNDSTFCYQQVKQFLQKWGWPNCGCDVQMYSRAMTIALQREAIAALRGLWPGNSAPFQRPCLGISCPRTVHPLQLHPQMPFTGNEFKKGDLYCTNTWQRRKTQTIHSWWSHLDKTSRQSVYH